MLRTGKEECSPWVGEGKLALRLGMGQASSLEMHGGGPCQRWGKTGMKGQGVGAGESREQPWVNLTPERVSPNFPFSPSHLHGRGKKGNGQEESPSAA